jgi:hypothetical protein
MDEGFITPVIPHLTLLWHLVSPKPLEFWYEYDTVILAKCDAIYRIEGESQGADKEVEFAREHHVPVFLDRGRLREWAKQRLESRGAAT